jgi:hypothetical protein
MEKLDLKRILHDFCNINPQGYLHSAIVTLDTVYTAFSNHVPRHRPHAERVAWIFSPSAGKSKSTAVP